MLEFEIIWEIKENPKGQIVQFRYALQERSAVQFLFEEL